MWQFQRPSLQWSIQQDCLNDVVVCEVFAMLQGGDPDLCGRRPRPYPSSANHWHTAEKDNKTWPFGRSWRCQWWQHFLRPLGRKVEIGGAQRLFSIALRLVSMFGHVKDALVRTHWAWTRCHGQSLKTSIEYVFGKMNACVCAVSWEQETLRNA